MYLEEKYGKPEVVAKEVIAELKSLEHKKLGRSFMSRFAITLNATYACLETIGELDWLTSNRSVSELEDQLPDSEKAEWAEVVPR